jgi:hypothetical protein
MVIDPSVLKTLAMSTGAGVPKQGRPPDIGVCFQLALLAAAEHNDEEVGGYIRQIIKAMKAMAKPEAQGDRAGEDL